MKHEHTQPEALRLADAIAKNNMTLSIECANELRRLHEINFNLCRKCNTLTIQSARDEDKIAALETINQELLTELKDMGARYGLTIAARAAIKEAEGEQK